MYRHCIVWVGRNSDLFKPNSDFYSGAAGLGAFQVGPQADAVSRKTGKPPKMWKWASLKKGSDRGDQYAWHMNFVAAHVEIRVKHKTKNKWITMGNWLIPTTNEGNSQTKKKCLTKKKGQTVGKTVGKRYNPNKWERLRTDVTAIKLPKPPSGYKNC